MLIGMKGVGLGSLLALLAVASGCGGKAQTQDSEPSFNMPASPPPFRTGGTPPRRTPRSPPGSVPPQAPLPGLPPPEAAPSESMPRELLEPGAEAPALADGVADAGATAEPESPPVVSAVDAGQGQPPTIGAVDPGSEPPPAIGAVDPGSEPPPVVVGAADAGADAG